MVAKDLAVGSRVLNPSSIRKSSVPRGPATTEKCPVTPLRSGMGSCDPGDGETDMNASCCPDPNELRAFSSGMLTGPVFDLVAEHVERCPLCDRALEAFDEPPDGLLTHLRRAPRDPQPEEGLPHGLLQAVRSLPIRSHPDPRLGRGAVAAGEVRAPRRARGRLLRPCVPRDRHGAGPHRGDQGPPGRRAHGPGRCRTVPPRGPQRGPAQAPGHRRPPRGRAGRRRHVLPGRGVRPRRDAGTTIAAEVRSRSGSRPSCSPRSPRRWTTPTATAWSTATSSPRTSCSTTTGGRT